MPRPLSPLGEAGKRLREAYEDFLTLADHDYAAIAEKFGEESRETRYADEDLAEVVAAGRTIRRISGLLRPYAPEEN